jgi:diadenosine tetraphosphate (Ap4A) HIT family hydrolase
MKRRPLDIQSYSDRVRSGPCFICELVRGNRDYAHVTVFEDKDTIVFLNKYPTLLGYFLVVPKAHREDLVTDLTESEYLNLQAVVYRVAGALKRVIPTERIYVLSLGSKDGNSHVHWDVAPLPPGVPYEQQQFHALMAENGVLDIPSAKMTEIAQNISKVMRE